MASFDNAAFDTDAFDTDSFDLDAEATNTRRAINARRRRRCAIAMYVRRRRF